MFIRNILIQLSHSIQEGKDVRSVSGGYFMRCPCCGGTLHLTFGAESAMGVVCTGNCTRESILMGLKLELKQVPELLCIPESEERRIHPVFCVHDTLEALALMSLGLNAIQMDIAKIDRMRRDTIFVVVHRVSEPGWAKRTVRELKDKGYQAHSMIIHRGKDLAKAMNLPEREATRPVNLSTLVRICIPEVDSPTLVWIQVGDAIEKLMPQIEAESTWEQMALKMPEDR